MDTKKYSIKTLADLATLEQLDALHQKVRTSISKIKSKCPHQDYKLKLVETLKFEMTPMRICVVCDTSIQGITREEKIALWQEHYDSMDGGVLTPEHLEKILDGMNFERPDFQSLTRIKHAKVKNASTP